MGETWWNVGIFRRFEEIHSPDGVRLELEPAQISVQLADMLSPKFLSIQEVNRFISQLSKAVVEAQR